MKAPELRELATRWLAERYPTALLVPELSIGNWGAALLDLAAVTEEQIVGIEIKGEGDSPARMPLQAAIYSKAATRMFLLPSPALEQRCFRHAPSAWGQLKVCGTAETGLFVARAEHHDWFHKQEPALLSTAPRQLLQALWTEELRTLARLNGVFTTRRTTAETLLDCISEDVPLKFIRAEVCRALRERDWAKFGKQVRWAADLAAPASQPEAEAA